MTKNLTRLFFYFGYLLVVWGCFRYFVRLPEVIEELWFKPVIWLLPLIWWQFSLSKRINLFKGNLSKALIWGLVAGAIYFVLLRILVGSHFSIDATKMGIVFVTATVEELTFSGFILTLLINEKKTEGWSLGLTSLGFALIHLPINIFVFHLPLISLVGAFVLAFFVAMINGTLRLRSNNVVSAIVAHMIYLMMVI